MADEYHKRSLAKAISWRITGTVDTFLISFLVTGHLKIASAIALTEVVTKIGLYYLHERFWTRIKWGQPAQSTVTPTVTHRPTQGEVK